MVKHAHSRLQARAAYCKEADTGLLEALKYIRDMRKIFPHGKKWHSVSSLLAEYSKMNPDKLTPSVRTVYRHINNLDTKTKAQAAADRQLLNPIEEKTLVSFIQKLAARAFPLGRQRIMLHALQIAHIRHPTHKAMGKSWFRRLQSRHPKELKAAWTRHLDTSRAAAVNPVTIKHYYELLEATLLEYAFTPSEIYGFDESGFPFGGDGIHERVFGGDGGIQHKQGEGNKENVSAMVTICADGTYTTPTAIFKGKTYNSAWAEAESMLNIQ
jgi:hypothetical protein